MATTKESRTKFFGEARKYLALLRKKPKLKRKHLVPLLADLFAGMLLILEEKDSANVKVSSQTKVAR